MAILSQEKGFKSFRIYGYTDKMEIFQIMGLILMVGKHEQNKEKNSGKSAGKEEQYRTLENV